MLVGMVVVVTVVAVVITGVTVELTGLLRTDDVLVTLRTVVVFALTVYTGVVLLRTEVFRGRKVAFLISVLLDSAMIEPIVEGSGTWLVVVVVVVGLISDPFCNVALVVVLITVVRASWLP